MPKGVYKRTEEQKRLLRDALIQGRKVLAQNVSDRGQKKVTVEQAKERKEKKLARDRRWRKTSEKWKLYRKVHAIEHRELCKRRRAILRVEVLTHYGPLGQLCCAWKGCQISDPDMLVLDHIKDDGAAQKRSLGGSKGRGWAFYGRLKRKGFPEGYQTLCCNHNQKKEMIRSRKAFSYESSGSETEILE